MKIAVTDQANVLSLPLVSRSDGSPVTSGTVNFYLVDQDGPNANKWYRGSDQTWQDTESIAGEATHRSAGHWYLSLPSAVWSAGTRYLLYAKEAGNGHVPISVEVLAQNEVFRKLVEADKVIDTSGSPWVLEYRDKDTKVVLLRQTMKNTSGEPITSVNNVLGQLELE